jgi:hypothetical protein
VNEPNNASGGAKQPAPSGDGYLQTQVNATVTLVTTRTQLVITCPACKGSLDVTGASIGNHVTCPGCRNVTYIPGVKWGYWKQVSAVIVAFAVGMSANFAYGALQNLLGPATPRDTGQLGRPSPLPHGADDVEHQGANK